MRVGKVGAYIIDILCHKGVIPDLTLSQLNLQRS